MAATITVLYPNTDEATFDLDYYLGSHMPLVGRTFAPFGLKGWRVSKAVEASGGKPRFSMIATLEFDTPDQFAAAVAAEGDTVFGDVPNFSNNEPVVVVGTVVGASG